MNDRNLVSPWKYSTHSLNAFPNLLVALVWFVTCATCNSERDARVGSCESLYYVTNDGQAPWPAFNRLGLYHTLFWRGNGQKKELFNH